MRQISIKGRTHPEGSHTRDLVWFLQVIMFALLELVRPELISQKLALTSPDHSLTSRDNPAVVAKVL